MPDHAAEAAHPTARPTVPIVDGAEPKHVQLRTVLATMCAAELPPGAAIPSERELMATYDVSRATVRKAIESSSPTACCAGSTGKGTFVARPRLESRLHLASFSQDMRRRGLTPSTRGCSASSSTGRRPRSPRRSASDRDAAGLAAGPGPRSPTAEPIALENGWYPKALLPGLDRHDLGGSLYELFARGLRPRHRHRRADAVGRGRGRDVTARRLDAPVDTPLLVFRRRRPQRRRRRSSTSCRRYRGDRYQLHMSLRRRHRCPETP